MELDIKQQHSFASDLCLIPILEESEFELQFIFRLILLWKVWIPYHPAPAVCVDICMSVRKSVCIFSIR